MSKKGLHERDRDYCYGHGVTANAGCFAQATEMTTYSIPPAANLTGKVIKKSEYAVAGGAFSDVWMGEYEGRVVAIKCPRLVNVTVDKLNQVSPHNLHVGSGCVHGRSPGRLELIKRSTAEIVSRTPKLGTDST